MRTHHLVASSLVRCPLVLLLALLMARTAPAQFPVVDPLATDEPAAETPSPDAGRAFMPRPLTEALYSIRCPAGLHSPFVQCSPADNDLPHYVTYTKGDRTYNIYVDIYLPGQKDAEVPPARVPVILMMTPYAATLDTTGQGTPPMRRLETVNYFVPLGYAVAIGHVFGTGNSDGCIDVNSQDEVDATAHVIDFLGEAEWSNGNVGMLGLSYDATTQLGVASRGDAALTRHLKAIVPVDGFACEYDIMAHDGVPIHYPPLIATQVALTYTALSIPPWLFNSFGADAGELARVFGRYGQRFECAPSFLQGKAQADIDGNYNSYYATHDGRPYASNIRAATLMVQHLNDEVVFPSLTVGLFERIPSTTPHKLLLGNAAEEGQVVLPQGGHGWPDTLANRQDWPLMVQAWFDRYLLDLPTGVEDWPDVQVQDQNGQWRAEPSWPETGGPVGQLALSAPPLPGTSGQLGANAPHGSTTFDEAPVGPNPHEVVFTTDRLANTLHITGMPVLDLWVKLSNPLHIGDAHVAVIVEALDANGQRISGQPFVFGARSAMHLDPMVRDYFEQSVAKRAPLDQPIHMPIRLMPTDLTVPPGGKLRVRIRGADTDSSSASGYPPYSPSGANSTVTILHDCAHPSALRFLMPRKSAQLINVLDREASSDALTSTRSPKQETDGGGLATQAVCGRRPLHPQG